MPGFGAQMEFRYERRYPATTNASAETEIAAATAAALVGEGNVKRDLLPSMGAEDFAFFLERSPGLISGSATAPPKLADTPQSTLRFQR